MPLHIPVKPNKACGITDAKLDAIPRPDGTAAVVAHVRRGDEYAYASDDLPGTDGNPHYKILIGSKVYGLLETPFLESDLPEPKGPDKTYRFEAEASDLRSARNFMVRDLAWDETAKPGTIRFAPTFTSASKLADDPATDPDSPGSMDPPPPPKVAGAKAAPAKAPTPKLVWYEVKGADFRQIEQLSQFRLDGSGPATLGVDEFYVFENKGRPDWPMLDQGWLPEIPTICTESADGTSPCGPQTRPILHVIDDSTLDIGFYEKSQNTPKAAKPANPVPAPVARTLHLVWKHSGSGPVDWALKVASDTGGASASIAAKVTSDPGFLYVSDGRTVKFTSSDSKVSIGCFVSAQFETTNLLPPPAQDASAGTPQTAHSTLSLYIPRSMTDRPGARDIAVQYFPLDSTTLRCATSGAKSTIVEIDVVGREK